MAAGKRKKKRDVSGQTLGLVLTAAVILTGLVAAPASFRRTSAAATADFVAPSVMVGAGTEGCQGEEGIVAGSFAGSGADEAVSDDAASTETESARQTRVRNQAGMWISSMAQSLDNLPAPTEQVIPQDSSCGDVLGLASAIAGTAQKIVTDNQKYSHEDYNTLLNIVEAECTGGDEKSKLLVADVILNRTEDSHFPDNIHDVVWQRLGGTAQFSPTQDGRMGTLKISDSTVRAVKRALDGEDISEGALFFMAREYSADDNVDWFDETLTYLYSYGGHGFYKFK